MTIKHIVSMTMLLIIYGFYNTSAYGQAIVEWTEENSPLGLGYPVPTPVDTPEPFDGFRTYNGLFFKHQSMALENPHITGQIIGSTHHNRDIWAYILSDGNTVTRYGIPEGNMLINGGIHAREWQSPEVLTGIMELFHQQSNDQFLYQYILENAAIVTIPVNNVDGFLHTQRYPRSNWLYTDPEFPNHLPRDGRMRRKNMRDVDENLNTQQDHLLGIDLNRNNEPFWAATLNSPNPASSADGRSLIYHGTNADSEPETMARINVTNLIDPSHLRVYIDVHSFSELFFSVRTPSTATNNLQSALLADFRKHHAAFPANKFYEESPNRIDFGIGTTTEYFAYKYKIPSATLEIEPTSGTESIPGGGADYGGFANNVHDGFILPESEIRRVREQLSESFAIMWYAQSGPPSMARLQIIDTEKGLVIQDYDWDIISVGATQRSLFINDIEPIIPGQKYTLIMTFDKPMRMLNTNEKVILLQGQNMSLTPTVIARINNQVINLQLSNGQWLTKKNSAIDSYQYYKTDTYAVDFIIPDDIVTTDDYQIEWSIITTDMVGQVNDANPATAAVWQDGQWINYENSSGNSSLSGGFDSNYSTPISTEKRSIYPPQTGGSALYYDISRQGEGIIIENLNNNQNTVQYYTYDNQDNQRWFYGSAENAGNRITTVNFPVTSGGFFGNQHDSDQIQLVENGRVEITFSNGTLTDFPVPRVARKAAFKYTAKDGSVLRSILQPIALVEGQFDALPTLNTPPSKASHFSGTWYDENLLGKGFHLQILIDGRALMLWYDYTPSGEQMWLFDSDGTITETENGIDIQFNNLVYTEGGKFGYQLNPENIHNIFWGTAKIQLTCNSGVFHFFPENNAYETSEYNVKPLTSLQGTDCSKY